MIESYSAIEYTLGKLSKKKTTTEHMENSLFFFKASLSGGGIVDGDGIESSHLPAKATPIWLHLVSHALEYVIPS